MKLLIAWFECSLPNFRTGKFVGRKVPGASLGVMMIEGIVPKSLRNWFRVIKMAIIDRTDNCEESFVCSLLDNDDEKEEEELEHSGEGENNETSYWK